MTEIQHPKSLLESLPHSETGNSLNSGSSWNKPLTLGIATLSLLGLATTGVGSDQPSGIHATKGSYTPPPSTFVLDSNSTWQKEIDSCLHNLKARGIPPGYLVDTLAQELTRVYWASKNQTSGKNTHDSRISNHVESAVGPFILDIKTEKILNSLPIDLQSPNATPPALFSGPGPSARTDSSCLLANEACALTLIHQKLVGQPLIDGIFQFGATCRASKADVVPESNAHIEQVFALTRNTDVILTAKWFEDRVTQRFQQAEPLTFVHDSLSQPNNFQFNPEAIDHLRTIGHQMQLVVPGIFTFASVAAGAGSNAISVEAARYNLSEQIETLVSQYRLGQSSLDQVTEVVAIVPNRIKSRP